MEGFGVRLVCWEDGEVVEKELEKTDRWEIHSAHEVHVTVNGVSVALQQKVREGGRGTGTQHVRGALVRR